MPQLFFRFDEDFASNWKLGDIVTCEEAGNDYLIDNGTVLIDKNTLLKHGDLYMLTIKFICQ